MKCRPQLGHGNVEDWAREQDLWDPCLYLLNWLRRLNRISGAISNLKTDLKIESYSLKWRDLEIPLVNTVRDWVVSGNLGFREQSSA